VTSTPAALGVFNKRLRDAVDLRIAVRTSPYMTRDLVEDKVRKVFIPDVEANRQRPECQSKAATLFCDNCACHCAKDTLARLARHGVLVILYRPLSSDISRVLDLLLSPPLKAAKKHLMRDPTVSPQLDHVMRLFRAYEHALISSTVRGSWGKTGFGFT
jgi:hypothetical protein